MNLTKFHWMTTLLIYLVSSGFLTVKAHDSDPFSKQTHSASSQKAVLISYYTQPVEPSAPASVFDDSGTPVSPGIFYQLIHKQLNAPVTYNPAEFSPANLKDNILVVRGLGHEHGRKYLPHPRGEWFESTLFSFQRSK